MASRLVRNDGAADNLYESSTGGVKFRQWFQDKRSKAKRLATSADEDGVKESLLPPPIYANLLYTASDSASIQISSQDFASGTKDSTFFQKIPPEIRHQIFLTAFGNQTLHMGIYPSLVQGKFFSNRRPGYRFLPNRRWLTASAEAAAQKITKKYNRDTSEVEQSLHWFGCICLRYRLTSNDFEPPHMDFCLRGRNLDLCDPWSGRAPPEFHIGVTGWLYACRQSYMEVSHILYATNTICWDNSRLFDALLYQQENPGQCILSPDNLELITSLEVRWKFELFSSNPETETKARQTLKKLLQFLPQALPKLRKLYICFENEIWTKNCEPERIFGEIADNLLTPLGDILQHATHLSEYTVCLSEIVFMPIARKIGVIDSLTPRNTKFWYPVEISNYTGSNSKGYWVDLDYQGELYIDNKGNLAVFRCGCSFGDM